MSRFASKMRPYIFLNNNFFFKNHAYIFSVKARRTEHNHNCMQNTRSRLHGNARPGPESDI